MRASGAKGDVIARDEDDTRFFAQVARCMRADPRPTAVIASNSAIALTLLKALRKLCVVIPRDASFLLFDEPEWADVVTPPLAVVRHPTAAIARAAWELLINRINAPQSVPQRVVFSAMQVQGESVHAPAGVR